MNTTHRAGLRQELIRDEGLRLAAYPDHLGFLTIGVGRLIDGRKPGGGISHDEALYLLDNDIKRCLSDLHQFMWFTAMDPIRQRAIVNMRFQLGPAGFRGFKRMIAALERKDYATAAAEARDSQWAQQTPARAARVTRQLETGLVG